MATSFGGSRQELRFVGQMISEQRDITAQIELFEINYCYYFNALVFIIVLIDVVVFVSYCLFRPKTI